MALDDEDVDVPDAGAAFTFGKSKFNNNTPGKFWLRDDTALQVSCGDEHTAIVSASGKLFTFGDNSWGQLGLGNIKPVHKPTRVKLLKSEKVAKVACGKSHTLVVTDSGVLYSFGANGDGQLGLKDISDEIQSSPTSVQLSKNTIIKMVVAGSSHSAFLTESGEVYVWGSGSEGQLGLDEVEKITTPTHLPFEDKIVHISCGHYHTAVVTATGKLFTCGDPEGGKLGLGKEFANHKLPQLVSGISEKVISVACGNNHTVAITDKGRVYTFGDGSNGQLGHGNLLLMTDDPHLMNGPSKADKIVFASCGESHTALISDRGVLYTFGDGRHGKLALGEENFSNQFIPMHVTRFDKFQVEQVSCGGCHMIVIAKPKSSVVGDVEYSDDSVVDSDEMENNGKTALNGDLAKKNEIYNIVDLSGSISARNRRREKQPDRSQDLNRTLPFLNGRKPLSPLVTQATEDDNPFNKKQLPPLTKNDSISAFSTPHQSNLYSTTEMGECSNTSPKSTLAPLAKPRTRGQNETEKPNEPPVPTPRTKPASHVPQSDETKDGESGIDDNEEEKDEDLDNTTPEVQSFSHKTQTTPEDKLNEDDIENYTKEKKEKEKKESKKRTGIFGRKKKPDLEEESDDDDDDNDDKKKKEKEKKKKKEKKKDKGKKNSKEEENGNLDANSNKGIDEENQENDSKVRPEMTTTTTTTKTANKDSDNDKDQTKEKDTKKDKNKGKKNDKDENDDKDEDNNANETVGKTSKEEMPAEEKKEEKKKSSFCIIL